MRSMTWPRHCSTRCLGLLLVFVFLFLSVPLSSLEITPEQLEELEQVLIQSDLALQEAEISLTSSVNSRILLQLEYTKLETEFNQLSILFNQYEWVMIATMVILTISSFFIGMSI